MPFYIGQRVRCIDYSSGADHLPRDVYFTIRDIRHTYTNEGLLLDFDMSYYRSSRFIPHYPHIYTRGSSYDSQLHPPIHSAVSRFGDRYAADDSADSIPPRGIRLDPHLYGISTPTSSTRPFQSIAIDSFAARHWQGVDLSPIFSSSICPEVDVSRPRRRVIPSSPGPVEQARTRLDHLRGYRGASSSRPPRS